jgi:hypothetical protein
MFILIKSSIKHTNKIKTMANIDVEPKQRSSILPWILGALALLLLLFFLFRGCNDDKDETVATTDTTSSSTGTATPVTTTDTGWGDIDFNGKSQILTSTLGVMIIMLFTALVKIFCLMKESQQ